MVLLCHKCIQSHQSPRTLEAAVGLASSSLAMGGCRIRDSKGAGAHNSPPTRRRGGHTCMMPGRPFVGGERPAHVGPAALPYLPVYASTPTLMTFSVRPRAMEVGGEALSTCLVLPITASSSSSLKRGRRRRCYSGKKTRPRSSLPLTMMKMAHTSMPSRWPTELQYFCGAGLLVPTPGTHNSIFSHSWRKG